MRLPLGLILPAVLWAAGSACAPGGAPSVAELMDEARSLADEGRFESAVELLEGHLRRNPRARRVSFTLGTIHVQAGDDARAAECFEQEIERNPEHAPSYGQVVLVYERLGRFEEMAATLGALAQLNPRNWRPHYQAGVVLRRYLGRLDEAAAEFEYVLAINPRHDESLVELGRVRMQQGRTDEARRAFEGALEIDGDNAQAHFQLGQLFLRAGEAEQGRRLLERFEVLSAQADRLSQLETAGTAAARYTLAEEYLARGKPKRALRDFEKAIELDPEFWRAHVGIARIKVGQGAAEDALVALAAAAEVAPGEFDVHYWRALALAALGRAQDAREAVEAARAIRPLDVTEERRVKEALKR